MSQLTRDEVERIAHLARLQVTEEEADALTAELDTILGYVELLSGVADEGVEPTSHVIPFDTPLRDDAPGVTLGPEAALANAPARDGFAFAVPKVLADEDEG